MHHKTRITRILAGLLIMAGILSGVCGPVSAGGTRFAASVLRVTGKAWQSPSGKRTQYKLANGSMIESGASVCTGAKSGLVLVFADGSRAELRQNTRVVVGPKGMVSQPRYDKTLYWLSSAQIKITIGSIWLQVRKHLDGLWGFEIETPAASVAVRGTEFSVTVSEDQSIDVYVESGLVEVYNTLGREFLSPGQSGHVNRGAKPTKTDAPGQQKDKNKNSNGKPLHGKPPGGKPGGYNGD